MTFTAKELEYLDAQMLGRLATVAPDGTVQNSPVGFFVNADGTIDIGGTRMGETKKFANVKANPKVSLVVDDLASRDPWTVHGVEIRGEAEALEDAEPPMEWFTRQVIRIHPKRIISWGLGGSMRPTGRNVASATNGS